MFEVIMNTINNPLKPEIVDSTTIILKQSQPFLQMSYKYDGDLTNLSDKEAIEKVLENFYSEHYREKQQDKQLLELELELARQKDNLTSEIKKLSEQNDLIAESLLEVVERLPFEEIEVIGTDEINEIEELEEGEGTDGSDSETNSN